MSVITRADEHLSAARERINEAILELDQIVVQECSGHDEYSRDFRDKLETVFATLRQMKRLIE